MNETENFIDVVEAAGQASGTRRYCPVLATAPKGCLRPSRTLNATSAERWADAGVDVITTG